MNLSEAIIKIHTSASEIHGELEADEFITSLLIVTLNKLKDTGELTPQKLESAFADVNTDYETFSSSFQMPKLYLVSNK